MLQPSSELKNYFKVGCIQYIVIIIQFLQLVKITIVYCLTKSSLPFKPLRLVNKVPIQKFCCFLTLEWC